MNKEGEINIEPYHTWSMAFFRNSTAFGMSFSTPCPYRETNPYLITGDNT